jgi:mRNA export factor
MDVRGAAMVVGTADRKLSVYDLSQGANFAVINQYDSPLNYQTRCVRIFSDVSGFAIGCIEGRVAIENFRELGKKSTQYEKSANFVFKCHRNKAQDKSSDIFPVNDISFTHLNTFSTVGSDGVINFWDKDERHRLRSYERFKGQSQISCSQFSPTGNLFVYALSYDWSMGAENNKPTEVSNNIMIHQNTPQEIQPKEKSTTASGSSTTQFGRR